MQTSCENVSTVRICEFTAHGARLASKIEKALAGDDEGT